MFGRNPGLDGFRSAYPIVEIRLGLCWTRARSEKGQPIHITVWPQSTILFAALVLPNTSDETLTKPTQISLKPNTTGSCFWCWLVWFRGGLVRSRNSPFHRLCILERQVHSRRKISLTKFEILPVLKQKKKLLVAVTLLISWSPGRN